MTIGRATISDCRAVAEVHVESWRHADANLMPAQLLASLSIDQREAMWLAPLERNAGHLLVAQQQGEIVGFAAFGACASDNASRGSAELWAIYVKPAFWSAGMGHSLLSAAIEQLTREGFSTVCLWGLAENHREVRFYERAGFLQDQEASKQNELGDTTLEELRYTRSLAS